MKIKPALGLKVRHPVTLQHIPADGIEVDANEAIWIRRLRSGDVVPVTDVVVTDEDTQIHDSPSEG